MSIDHVVGGVAPGLTIRVDRRRRLARELWRNRGAAVGLVALLLFVVGALLAPVLSPNSPTTIDLAHRLADPVFAGGTWSHPLGTDQLGRDELARLLYSARVSLTTAALVVLIGGAFGTGLGVAAGYMGGWWEKTIMGVAEAAVAFPGLLLALAVVVMVGPSQTTLVVVLSAITWTAYTWVAHDIVRSLRETPFVRAAETLGSGPVRVIVRHLIPNLASPMLTIATLEFAVVVLGESSLSYLGLGIQPPESSWGLMVAEGQTYLSVQPWLVALPGIAIALVVLAVNLVAGGLRIVTDPRQRERQFFGLARHHRRSEQRRVTDVPNKDSTPLLAVGSLAVEYPTVSGGIVHAVCGVSFELRQGETLGLVGESGSGKSTVARAIIGLVESPGWIAGGDVRWREIDKIAARRQLVGDRVTVVFQDSTASLNPLVSVGRQLTEVLRKHKGMSRSKAEARAVELLDLVGLPFPERRLNQFPYEFSGGMAQRVAIAIALAPEPDLIIADEPTTALDVTTQAQILDLLQSVQAEFGMSMILITHDLGVVAGMCDRVAVMYAGTIVESGLTAEIFHRPRHPYTAGLIRATPRLDRARRSRLESIPGTVPNGESELAGCPFAPRCTYAQPRCRVELPRLTPGGRHQFACWYPLPGASAESVETGG